MANFSDFISFVSQSEYLEPSYTYQNLDFEQLPAAARQVLVDNGIISSNIDSFPASHIARIRNSHLVDFGDCLQDIQTKLILSRRRVVRINEAMERYGEADTLDDKLQDVQHILYNLEENIIPEWHSHLDRYVYESDALVWLQVRNCGDEGLPSILEERASNIRHAIETLTMWLDDIHDLVVRLEKERRFLEDGRVEEIGVGERDEFAERDLCFSKGEDMAHCRYTTAPLPTSPAPWMKARARGWNGN